MCVQDISRWFNTLEDAITACNEKDNYNGVMLIPNSVAVEQTIGAKRKAMDKPSEEVEKASKDDAVQVRKRKLNMLKDDYNAGDIDKDTYLYLVAMQYL